MNGIIKECIDKFINEEIMTEYNTNNNKEITDDIHNLMGLLIKFREELFKDIDERHARGEMVSKNEAIIKKVDYDIHELYSDLQRLVKEK